MEIGQPEYLQLLWCLPLGMLLFLWGASFRRRAMGRFASGPLRQQLSAGVSSSRRLWKQVLFLAALAAMAVGLADVRWGESPRQVQQRGIDVLFLVDVSRSMLAEDAAPNRLERARQQIRDMLGSMQGDRVGLIAFAGDARRVVPLTTNYLDFQQALAELEPESVRYGGSDLANALLTASDSFLDKTADHKAVVVFSDGEDQPRGEDPVEMASRLERERGMRIFTVGLGDASRGARIPIAHTSSGTQYLEHDGQQVWSKLDEQMLREVASAGGGAYVPAATKQVDMQAVYRQYIASIEQQEFQTRTVTRMTPRYRWFVGLAVGCLAAALWINESRAQRVSFASDANLEG